MQTHRHIDTPIERVGQGKSQTERESDRKRVRQKESQTERESDRKRVGQKDNGKIQRH